MKNLMMFATCLLLLTCCSSQQEQKDQQVKEDQIVKEITQELEGTSQEIKSVTEEKLTEIDTLLNSL